MPETPHPFLLELFAEREWKCPDCGYSLRGCRSARCPECGTTLEIEAIIAAADRPRNRRAAWRIAILAAPLAGFCILSQFAIDTVNADVDSMGGPILFMWLFRFMLGTGFALSVCFELLLMASRGRTQKLDGGTFFWLTLTGVFFASLLALPFALG